MTKIKLSKRLSKLFNRRKNIVTVESLLGEDDVNEAIEILKQKRTDIKSLMIIHVNKNGTYGIINTDDITNADWVWFTEQIKSDIFRGEE